MTTDNANPSAPKRQVEIHSTGLAVPDPSAAGGKRHFPFSAVDFVLLSSESVLSFQIGQEVFSIRIKRDNPRHMQIVGNLLRTLHSTSGPGAGAGG